MLNLFLLNRFGELNKITYFCKNINMVNIIAGKWYKNKDWNSPNRDFCKARDKTPDSNIYFSEQIYDGRHTVESSCWSYVDSCVEASYEEYAQYLPEGHPDLVKLGSFPSDGFCKSLDSRLINYLHDRPKSLGNLVPRGDNIIGVGWNFNSWWWIANSSSKKEYQFSDLERFFLNQTETKIDSWCVQITKENRKTVKEYFSDLGGYCFSNDAYYGVNTYGKRTGHDNKDNFNTLLTTEEFYKKIGLKDENNWHVLVTNENVDVVKNWRGSQTLEVGYIAGMFKNSPTSYTKEHNPPSIRGGFGYEITTEEFYKKIGHTKKVNMFKKGDYIVTLDVKIQTDCAKNNYCFKIRENNDYVHPEIDLSGSEHNGNTSLSFDKTEQLKDWRYATEEEILRYNKLGKPYDVTVMSLVDYSGSQSSDWVPKVGDWVVFEVNRCVGSLGHCRTSVWDRNMVLQIIQITQSGFKFDAKDIEHCKTFGSEIGNNKELFRKAESWEIPAKYAIYTYNPCGEIKILPSFSYTSPIGTGEIFITKNKKSEFPLFIDTPAKRVVQEDKPIKIISSKKLKINLVD